MPTSAHSLSRLTIGLWYLLGRLLKYRMPTCRQHVLVSAPAPVTAPILQKNDVDCKPMPDRQPHNSSLIVPATSLRPRSYLAEVARVVLVHHDAVVVLATRISPTAWMLPVLADTAMAGADVSALLAVLVQACGRRTRQTSGRLLLLPATGHTGDHAEPPPHPQRHDAAPGSASGAQARAETLSDERHPLSRRRAATD